MKHGIATMLLVVILASLLTGCVGNEISKADLQSYLNTVNILMGDGGQIIGYGIGGGKVFLVEAWEAAGSWSDYTFRMNQVTLDQALATMANRRANGWYRISWNQLPEDVKAYVVGTIAQTARVYGLFVVPVYTTNGILGKKCMTDAGVYVDCNKKAPTALPYDTHGDPRWSQDKWYDQQPKAKQCFSADGLAVVPCN